MEFGFEHKVAENRVCDTGYVWHFFALKLEKILFNPFKDNSREIKIQKQIRIF